MRLIMKKCRKLTALFGVLTVVLAACGQQRVPDTVEETTIAVDKNGGVTYHLVGDFEKEYYDLSELASMAAEEAAEYNGIKASGEERPVTVDKVELLAENEDRVKIEYLFDSAESFSEFTGEVLFYGTVDEAVSRGYSLQKNLKSVRDGAQMTAEQLKLDGERSVIITDIKAVVYCPSKVAFLSEGAILREDGSVDVSQAEETVCMVLK